MQIVLVGAGKVGELLCTALAQEKHDVTLIEQNERRLEQLINKTDITGVEGNGALLESQLEAGVDHCDIFIAVTPIDETNIIAAITARKIGARHTIARVRSPEYSMQMQFLRESLGISTMINPELEASRDIARMIRFPEALNIEYFDHGRVNILELVVHPDSDLVGLSLADLGQTQSCILVCALQRGEDFFIPDGSSHIEAGDHLHVTGPDQDLLNFARRCRQLQQHNKSIRRALIVGGGRLTRYLLPRLERMGIDSKVIEVQESSALTLAAAHPRAEIICGDGTSQAFLKEERLARQDVFIALTGIDEENILISLFAAKEGVPRTITKVNRTDLLKVIDQTALQAVITPRRIIANQIVRLVRSLANSQGSNVEAYYNLSDGKAELLQFRVSEDSPVCACNLMELKTKPGLLIASIIRDGDIIFPRGQNRLRPHDEVIVITTHPNFQDIRDILA